MAAAFSRTCSAFLSRTFAPRLCTPSLAASPFSQCRRALSAPASSTSLGQLASSNPYREATPEALWAARSKDALLRAERIPPADAYAGRSVNVLKGDVAGAIRAVEGILNRNKVRYYLRLRKRHEKRSDMLTRLRSERWRKQFAAAVRQKAQLVTKIRNRGA